MDITHEGILYQVNLCDDGTLDTVFEINGKTFRYGDFEYRDDKGRVLSFGYEMALEDYLNDLTEDVCEKL